MQITEFEQRKQDHIRLALEPRNTATGLSGFDEIELIHEALPDFDFADIDISTTRFGSKANPFFVSSMTAGHQGALNINHVLASACAESGWAMGVGSQRRQLFDEAAPQEWQALRREFPQLTLYANLGISQLQQHPYEKIREIIDSLGAAAIFIHCNPLQECLQPEGTPQFSGAMAALQSLCKLSPVPVILKETGCGFSQKTLQKLIKSGIAALDVSGKGGTHWGRIEGDRAAEDSAARTAASTFKNWGVSTVESLRMAHALHPDYEIWGSGGVRNGLDAAKCIALGASSVGIAKPMLEKSLEGKESVLQLMKTFEFELTVALFCTGSRTLSELCQNGHGR